MYPSSLGCHCFKLHTASFGQGRRTAGYKNPPCQARGWTGCSPRRRGKLPVIGHPTPRGAGPGFGCLVDSYVLLNHESTHPEGARSTRILRWRTGTKKELVDIIQNRRNPTGMVHSGNSGPCETGETASAPPNQPQAVGAVSTKRGSSPGSGAWNALRRLRQRLSRRAPSA